MHHIPEANPSTGSYIEPLRMDLGLEDLKICIAQKSSDRRVLEIKSGA